MSNFKLSKRSMSNLKGVHPALVSVIQRAIDITPYDFGVSQGVRTVEEQRILYEQKKSMTLDSYHLKQHDGYSHAVDIYVFVNGKINWQHKYYRKVIQAMFTAAIELGVQIEAGGLWKDFLDSPHIQLNRTYYG